MGAIPDRDDRQDRGALTPPDPTGLEAWIRQVLGLAGARASSFTPPLPIDRPTDRPGDASATPPERDAADGTGPA